MQITATVTRADQPIRDAIEERPGLPIRIRVQPTILRQEGDENRASYKPWKDVHWIIEAENLDEVRLLRESLAAFFWIASQGGIGVLYEKLVPGVPVSTP